MHTYIHIYIQTQLTFYWNLFLLLIALFLGLSPALVYGHTPHLECPYQTAPLSIEPPLLVRLCNQGFFAVKQTKGSVVAEAFTGWQTHQGFTHQRVNIHKFSKSATSFAQNE